ncbi:hypothetical protein [Thiomicrorhabdus cannonii]|nr:hypothetical protein [Thiomicrorhabdus cannonii]
MEKFESVMDACFLNASFKKRDETSNYGFLKFWISVIITLKELAVQA